MQKPRIEQPWSGPTRYHHLLNVPSVATSKKAWKEKSRCNQSWWSNGNKNRPQTAWATCAFTNLTRRVITPTLVATFGRDLKGLVPVGNSFSVAGENIPDVPQDCVLCTYHPMLSSKIKKGFGLGEVSILTPADASGPTVQSTDVGTYKSDGFTFKNEDGW